MNARARKRKRAHTSVKVIRSGAAGSAGGGACGEGAGGEKRGRVGIIVVQTTAEDIDVPSELCATRYQKILSQRIKSTWGCDRFGVHPRGFKYFNPSKVGRYSDSSLHRTSKKVLSHNRNLVPPASPPLGCAGPDARYMRRGSRGEKAAALIVRSRRNKATTRVEFEFDDQFFSIYQNAPFFYIELGFRLWLWFLVWGLGFRAWVHPFQ